MKKTGAWLAVYALEQLGIRYTFGIPGVHNTEIYDELNKSKSITPILVTHEGGGAFMADAISRTTSHVGCMVIVPAAGMTHALSGIGEAWLAGVPMLILSGGIRTDSGRSYQLHDIDQHSLLSGITKKSVKVTSHDEIVPAIFDAYSIAISGEPGPVFVEIPVNVQLFRGEIVNLPLYSEDSGKPVSFHDHLDEAAELLRMADNPGIFAGWGAHKATASLVRLAEKLGAPVATSLQGLGVFPGNHPLHTGMGFGAYAVPAAEEAFSKCDLLLAVGVRFGEIATGSFGMNVPERLIHVDINDQVFNRNYPAEITLHGDSDEVLSLLLEKLGDFSSEDRRRNREALIASGKERYRLEWEEAADGKRVNPWLFFRELRSTLKDDAIIVADDGNHTFLAAELMEIRDSGQFISPTDFNCMGYCVPASIGAKIGNPKKEVAGICGDGAFLMTGMELLTATEQKAGVMIFVFNDGELSQISQGQEIPYNRKVCTRLGKVHFEGVAIATGAAYVRIERDDQIRNGIEKAMQESERGRPVLVDLFIDYRKATRFTKGIVKTNLDRFPLKEKIRFISRALVRKITG